MKTFWTILTLTILNVTNGMAQERRAPVHIGLIYPLSTNGTAAKETSNLISLHAVAGVSFDEKAAAISGAANVVRRNADGILAAGVYNHVGNRAQGFQTAGAINYLKGDSRGVALAGAVNVTSSYTGFQSAGAVNFASNSLKAWQVAGFANLTQGDVDGVQWAGFANTARNVNGLQLSGFANVSDEVDGAQLAGFVNVARKVRGIQFSGFLNLAEESDYPIGLVNIIKNGDRQLGVYVDELMSTTLSFRSGGRVLYGLIGVGYNFHPDSGEELMAIEAGMGAHLVGHPSFRMNLEVAHSSLEEFKKGMFMKSSLRILPELYVGDHIRLMGGPSFSYLQTDADWGKKVIPVAVWTHDIRDTRHAMHFGWTAGISWTW